jgi:thiazole/oxazole-forming peptide maturase SagC family component
VARQSFSLREDVRVYLLGDDEVRLRKGIWNHVEAIINLRGQSTQVRTFFRDVVDRLNREQEVHLDELVAHAGLSAEDGATFAAIFADVTRQGFIYSGEEARVRRAVSGMLGGSRSGLEEYVSGAAPVLLASDNPLARELAVSTAKQMGLPLQVLDFDVLEALARADLTTRTDAVEYEKTMEKFQKYFAEFSCVAGVFLSPNVSLLRNMNRILVKQEKAFVLGLIDGPFASVFASVAKQSGCFECYEQRLLARIEDMAVYHRFVEATSGQLRHHETAAPFAPITNLLTSGVLMEATLLASMGLSRLAGRVLSVYMPLMEIQVQDLLRVPYCPACGHVSQNQMSEMYLNAQTIMDRMLQRIEIAAPGASR